MNSFNGPAGKRVDAKLFSGTSPGLSRLNKVGRAELRQNARQAYWLAKQAAAQQASQSSTTQASQ